MKVSIQKKSACCGVMMWIHLSQCDLSQCKYDLASVKRLCSAAEQQGHSQTTRRYQKHRKKQACSGQQKVQKKDKEGADDGRRESERSSVHEHDVT